MPIAMNCAVSEFWKRSVWWTGFASASAVREQPRFSVMHRRLVILLSSQGSTHPVRPALASAWYGLAHQ